jgi:Mrp family chromosome partitioning ATPase
MFGIKEKAMGCDDGIIPVETKTGVKLMSINLLLENDTDPVVWRGSLIAGTVKQFWSDVCWGDVDFMFVDMPPGTGDVPLTVFQSLPVDGIIIVASPQELVGMIVEKAVNMAKMMNIPVIGIVENMSYMACPDCGKKLYPFGEGKTAEVAAKHGLPLLAQLPIDPAIAAACDAGKVEDVVVYEIMGAVNAALSCPKKEIAE